MGMRIVLAFILGGKEHFPTAVLAFPRPWLAAVAPKMFLKGHGQGMVMSPIPSTAHAGMASRQCAAGSHPAWLARAAGR